MLQGELVACKPPTSPYLFGMHWLIVHSTCLWNDRTCRQVCFEGSSYLLGYLLILWDTADFMSVSLFDIALLLTQESLPK